MNMKAKKHGMTGPTKIRIRGFAGIGPGTEEESQYEHFIKSMRDSLKKKGKKSGRPKGASES